MKTKNIMFTFFLLCISIVTFGQIDSLALQQIGGLVSAAIQSTPEVQKNPFGFLIGIAITNLIGFLYSKFHRKKNYKHNDEIAKIHEEYQREIKDLKSK